MSNRLEIELTSAKDDGTYTWRAAGARQPKGVVDAKLLTAGAKVGDVLRVEAEFEIDGITILSVLPSKGKETPAGRIELLGSAKPSPGVTTVLVSEGGRGRRGGDRRELLDSGRRPERGGGRGRPARERDRGAPERAPSTGRAAPEHRARTEGGRAGAAAAAPQRRPQPAGAGRPDARRAAAGRPAARETTGAGPTGARPGAREARRAPARFESGSKHRDALFAELPPEQRPIAERLAVGGLPAVRRAVAGERERARAEGRPEASGEAIVSLAEQLVPSVKQAMWLDRAEAAVEQLERISLRDLRATVVAAAPRDEAGRAVDHRLREELDRRVTKLRTTWESQMTHALEEGRVLQALRLSAQPPEPTARFPASLVEALADKAGAAMTAETPPDRWLAMLTAAVASPIRRQIHPRGLPEDPSGEVQRRARVAAGSLPALAPLLGLTMPPPPKPLRPPRPPRPARPDRPGGPATRSPRTPGTTGAGASPEASGLVAGAEAPVLEAGPEVAVLEAAPEAPVLEAAPEAPVLEAAPEAGPLEAGPTAGEPAELEHEPAPGSPTEDPGQLAD